MTAPVIDIKRIMEMIPHRYPFLLVDRMIEVVPDVRATGLKNVTMNEPQFMGHFPGTPIMPGVLIIEAMAQTAAILVVQTVGDSIAGKLVYFMSIEDGKFRKPVVPGDALHIHVEKIKSRGNVWKFKGEAKVGGELCAEAIVTAMIVDDAKKAG